MVSVACFVAHTGAASGLVTRLSRSAAVHLFEERSALMAYVRTTPVSAVVVDLRDALGRPTSGTVRALRAVAPRLPVLARCRLAEHDCRALLDFARAGGTDVLVEDGGYDALLAILAHDGRARAQHSALVTRLLSAGVPSWVAPVLEHAFANLDEADAAGRGAERLGIGRRALERRLARAGLPSPRVLHSWCRLLAAADRLRGDAVAVERIALDVGFASANALRNALQRYGETTPSALRAGDGLDALVERLCARRHADAGRRRVAERAPSGADAPTCDVRAALLARARLLDCLTTAFARREACRVRCASPARRGGTVGPRSRRRTSASAGGRAHGDTSLDRRQGC
jgi:AraC-like DNA-binding protein